MNPGALAPVRHPARAMNASEWTYSAKLKGLNNGVFLLHAVWYQNAKIQFITQAGVYCTYSRGCGSVVGIRLGTSKYEIRKFL